MDNPAQLVVVCGLGGLGHACLRTLRHFDVPLNCLDLAPLPMGMDMGKDEQWVVGDMRNPDALQQAGVSQARAVLLLSSNSGVNLEASLQVRLLNPAARVVVRSNGSGSLERHLRERLPGLVLVDPELLTAGVFANALRPDGSEAAFSVAGEVFRVVRRVQDVDSQEDLFALQGRLRRLLQWCPAQRESPGQPASQWWDWGCKPQVGDQLLWLEATSSLESHRSTRKSWLGDQLRKWRLALESVPELWRGMVRGWNGGVVLGMGLVALVLIVGSLRFGFGSPLRGLLITIALLKGEYIDALSTMTGGGALESEQLGLATLSLAFALGGTLFTALLVAVILEWLLAKRLGGREPSPLAAGSGYVLLVGGSTLARRLERLLTQGRSLVRRVRTDDSEPSDQVFRTLDRALRVLRHGRCKAVAVLGDDLMANLETALSLQDRWPKARLAVQSHSLSRASELSQLFPGMEVINPLELAAEAVVATAFGERVREVLRVADTNLLLTDYRVESGDTLAGKSLGQISEGFGVMPISLIPNGQTKGLMLPGLDRVVQPGDALLVMSALSGLRRVESGRTRPANWCLELAGMGVGADRFEAQMLLARHLNQPPRSVAYLLDYRLGPQRTRALHQGQGRELLASLKRLGVKCDLVSALSDSTNLGVAGLHPP